MSQKWQVGIYLIHDTNKTTKQVYEVLENEDKTYTQKQTQLKNKLLEVDSRYKYKSVQVNSENINDLTLYLFYRKHPKQEAPWKEFLKTQIPEDTDITKEIRNKNESFVLFLYQKTDKKLYAVSGGYGAFTIQNFIVDDFGINILIRIIKGKEEKVLKSAKEFGVTGGVIGISKYFRSEYNFYENDNFGNIYREVAAYIDKDTASLLGITNDTTKQCIAKNNFKLNQSITFDEMIKIVTKLNEIMKNDANFTINEIKTLDNKKDETLIQSLKKEVLENIWHNKNNIEEIEEKLDFVHKDIDKFLLADKFKCYRTNYDNIKTLFSEIINEIKSKSKEDFIKVFDTYKVSSFDESSNISTEDKFFNHLIYEVNYDGKSYFLINSKFYQIENNFKDRLNKNCKIFIEHNYSNGLDKDWGNIKEGEYNLSYKDDDNTIVLDTITPQSIEPCDILKYDNDNVYLYHVKKGFNGSMRDLTSQVFTSANRIKEDIASDKSYLKELYEKMQTKEEYKNQVSSEDEFLAIFDKKLHFILAVKDKNNRELKNVEQFSSNIAKFALNELIKNMKSIDVNFMITQINHIED